MDVLGWPALAGFGGVVRANNLQVKNMLWALLLVVLVPNILFASMAWVSGVGRSWINLDYAFAALFVVLGWRWLGVLLFFVFLLVDLLVVVGQLFPFIRLHDLIYLAKFVFLPSSSYQLAMLLVVFGLFVKCVFFSMLSRLASREAVLLVFNLLLLGYVVKVYAVEPADDRFWRVSAGTLVSSKLIDFIDYRSHAFLKTASLQGEPFRPLPADAAVRSEWLNFDGGDALPEKMLLVLAESWGVPHDERLQQALLRPLKAVASGGLKQGELSFFGATLAGELRELCLLSPNHFNLASVKEGFEDCLPNLLREQGYRTASMHGAVSLMYDRKDWYPKVGFEERIFFESREWPQRCYSFPGACDLDLREAARDFLVQDGQRFMYWLTLNSHAVYDVRDIRTDVFDCGSFSISVESLECRNLKLQAQFFTGLADLLASEGLKGVAVLVVGDHAPALARVQGPDAVFADGLVPWVSFVVD